MSNMKRRKKAEQTPKVPECGGCGYSPTRTSENLTERLAEAGYDRPYVEVAFGLSGEGRALLCPVCGTVIRRTD